MYISVLFVSNWNDGPCKSGYGKIYWYEGTRGTVAVFDSGKNL